MRKIVAPLALLASITLLTSCTKKEETPVVAPVSTESQPAVMEDINPVPPPPAPPVPPPPPPLPPVDGMPPAVNPTETGATSPEAMTQPAAAISRTETVSYKNPAGDDSVEFSVTVENGVITAATATPKAEHEISKKRQEAFAAAVSASVVGKNAKDLDVSAIGGSSLTTGAFKMFVQSF